MSFVSFEWVYWMAVTTALFWLVPARLRFVTLTGLTFAFLLVTDAVSAVILLALTLFTWFVTRTDSVNGRRAMVGVLPILAVLGFFKVWSAASGDDLLTDTLIPLGLSFYTLRCMHFVLERYKGRIAPTGLPDVASYLFFLPTIFIGPIHRYPAFDRDVRRHRWDTPRFSEGLERILYGYVKITFIANYLVSEVYVDWVAGLGLENEALLLYADMLRISFNLYYQFAGASDIAIGFGLLLGFRVMENFDKPYLKSNISDFWRSWHISLTDWLREYVYTGVIALTRSSSLGVLTTLLGIALWHEVSWRYVIWGFYHGFGILVWQRWHRLRRGEEGVAGGNPITHGFSVLLTFHFVAIGFLLVRQPDPAAMFETARTLLFFWG